MTDDLSPSLLRSNHPEQLERPGAESPDDTGVVVERRIRRHRRIKSVSVQAEESEWETVSVRHGEAR